MIEPEHKRNNSANLNDVFSASKRRQRNRTIRTLILGCVVPLLIGVAIITAIVYWT